MGDAGEVPVLIRIWSIAKKVALNKDSSTPPAMKYLDIADVSRTFFSLEFPAVDA